MIKKGQAAMEFLMTYGWAILAAIIGIGFLAYFGAFSSESITGNTISMTTPFIANAFVINNDDTITFELIQNIGKSIQLVNSEDGGNDAISLEMTGNQNGVCDDGVITTSKDILYDTPNPPGDVDPYGDTPWATSEKVAIEIDCSNSLTWEKNDHINANIKVRYKEKGSNIVKTGSGSLKGISN